MANWPWNSLPTRTSKNQCWCGTLTWAQGSEKPGRDKHWMLLNTDHSWLRKFPKWKVLRKRDILRRKYHIRLPLSHFFSGVHLWSLLGTNHSGWVRCALPEPVPPLLWPLFSSFIRENIFTVFLPADEKLPSKTSFFQSFCIRSISCACSF